MNKDEIRALRASLHLSTRDFGALVGVSGRAVENWEQGRRKAGGAAVVVMRRMEKEANNGR